MKKFVSIVVTLAMLFAMTSVSFAAEVSATPNTKTYIGEVENGNIFTMQANDKSVVALTNNESHLIDISIQYSNQPDTVYQQTLTNYSVSTRFAPENVSFWLGVIDYVEQNLDDASIVQFETVIYDVPIDITSVRTEAGRAIREQMIELLGTDEYFNLPLLSDPFYYQGEEINIYHSMEFWVQETASKTWSQITTVSSIIVNVLGLTAANERLISILCSVLGIPLAQASQVLPGGLRIYSCSALNYKYITINNSNYIYNMTQKLTHYTAYEDIDDNSTAGVLIDPDSKTTTYTENLNYFTSISAQTADAYELFLEIGQMP